MHDKQEAGGRSVGCSDGTFMVSELEHSGYFYFYFLRMDVFFYVCACTMSFTNTCKEITQLNGSH